MPEVRITRRSYLGAAQEHLVTAERQFRRGFYVVAHYFAGIAVESILRSLSRSRLPVLRGKSLGVDAATLDKELLYVFTYTPTEYEDALAALLPA